MKNPMLFTRRAVKGFACAAVLSVSGVAHAAQSTDLADIAQWKPMFNFKKVAGPAAYLSSTGESQPIPQANTVSPYLPTYALTPQSAQNNAIQLYLNKLMTTDELTRAVQIEQARWQNVNKWINKLRANNDRSAILKAYTTLSESLGSDLWQRAEGAADEQAFNIFIIPGAVLYGNDATNIYSGPGWQPGDVTLQTSYPAAYNIANAYQTLAGLYSNFVHAWEPLEALAYA